MIPAIQKTIDDIKTIRDELRQKALRGEPTTTKETYSGFVDLLTDLYKVRGTIEHVDADVVAISNEAVDLAEDSAFAAAGAVCFNLPGRAADYLKTTAQMLDLVNDEMTGKEDGNDA